MFESRHSGAEEKRHVKPWAGATIWLIAETSANTVPGSVKNALILGQMNIP